MSNHAPINISSLPKAIVHVDGDAFFASCEQALHPEYRGKPVITGRERGIAASYSYEASRYGVTRAMTLSEVKKVCPQAIIIPNDYETYSLFSKRMFTIMRRFSPIVEEYSIDEGFIDLTGLRRPLGMSYPQIAREIKRTIQKELGVSVSVGLAASKTLAKVASGWSKPDGYTYLPNKLIHRFLGELPVGEVWGIGPNTAAYMSKIGIITALDFIQKPQELVREAFTKPHLESWQELRGHSIYEVLPEEKQSYASISKTKTFTPHLFQQWLFSRNSQKAKPTNVSGQLGFKAVTRKRAGFTTNQYKSFVYAQLIKNLENACIKARRHQLLAKRLIIFLKAQDFSSRAVQADITRASAYPSDLTPLVQELFQELFESGVEYRATGVVLSSLQDAAQIQGSLFESATRLESLQRIYEAVDRLSSKHGKHTVHLGASLQAKHFARHVGDRGDAPGRHSRKLRGERGRKRLGIPVLQAAA